MCVRGKEKKKKIWQGWTTTRVVKEGDIEQQQRMEERWIVRWVEKKIDREGEAGSPHWDGHVTLQRAWHTEREYHISLSSFSVCLALFSKYLFLLFYLSRLSHSLVRLKAQYSNWHSKKSFFGAPLNSAFPPLKRCCSIMHDFMHNFPLDFPVTVCISTPFLHGRLHYCLLWRFMLSLAFFCIRPHTCARLARKHICVRARGAFGSCWELPVYLINSTWLEAKDMQTRKGKINTKIKYFPPDLLWRKKHFPMTGKAKERRGEKG